MAATEVELTADARRGNMKRLSITLSATPNTVTTVVVPEDAKGFGIRPAAATVDYNVNAAPAAVTGVATDDQSAVSSDMYAGGFAFAGEWVWRMLEPYHATSNPSRVLHLMSATASAVVYVEFF